jgi:glutaminyl-tRNA synthetase
LFQSENPEESVEGKTFLDNINPNSVTNIVAVVEPELARQSPGTRVQFERNGYFVVDEIDSLPDKPVFNRIVTLRDSWAKIASK